MSSEELTQEEQQALTDMEGASEADATEQSEQVEQEQADEPEASKSAEEEPQQREKPPEGYVPHGAMHAERQRRQELERKLAEIEAKLTAQEQPKEQPPAYVDPLEDPEGFRKWSEYNSQTQQQTVQKFLEQQRAEQERAQRVQLASKMEAEFAAKTPDYQDAVQSLHQARVSQLQSAGYTEQEIRQQIMADAEGIFNAATAAGINPAQLLYIRAQEAGYRPQAAQQATQAEADRIAAKARAQEQTQGIGSAGGGEQGGQLTAAQLAEMSEEELGKLDPDVIRRAMGG